MAKEAPGRKDYDGKTKKSPFQAIENCQIFATSIYMATAKAEKEYRLTICRKLQDLACEIIHNARLANSINLFDPYRQEIHHNTLECMERINDLLPVIRRLKCISPNQEAEMQKKLSSLRFGYIKWMESDKKRIGKDQEKDM